MSHENVETVRAVYEAWNAGDLAGIRELFDPDAIVVRYLEGWPEPGPFIGREAIMQLIERSREAWDTDQMELLSVIDSADRVVARQCWHAVGRGPDWNMEATVVYTLRAGKIFLMEFFWSH